MQIKINADISRIDYQGIIGYIKKNLNVSRNIFKKIGFKIICKEPIKDFLLRLIAFEPINKSLRSKLSELVDRNIHVVIIIKKFDLKPKDVDLKDEGESLKISLDCSIENLNDILSFVEAKINLKDENMKSIIISSIRAVKEIVDDDSKLKLIDHVLNDSSEEIYRYLTKLISEKMFQIQIDNIEFESKNNIKE